MQGLFVGDEQTPSECLKRHLSRNLKARVEVLNTGHLGYSPEQEYYTLREYADRFRPRFVVLSLFANDFGDLFEVLEGKGDWEEGKYWLGQITQFCRTRGFICLTVPAPWVNQLKGHARPDSIRAWSRTSWNPRASSTWIRSRTSPPSCCGFPQSTARREADLAQPTLQRFTRRRPLLASSPDFSPYVLNRV